MGSYQFTAHISFVIFFNSHAIVFKSILHLILAYLYNILANCKEIYNTWENRISAVRKLCVAGSLDVI